MTVQRNMLFSLTSGVCTTLPRLHMRDPYTLSSACASIVSALFNKTLGDEGGGTWEGDEAGGTREGREMNA